MRYVIISGGHIEDAFAREWLEKNKFDKLIAADSGINFLHRNGIKPDIIAGDFDSAAEENLQVFLHMPEVEVLRLNPIKDDTDTEFVLREAIRRGATDITILGATGTRLDHVLANIHLLGIGLEEGVKIQLLDVHNRIQMIDNELTITKSEQFGEFVSILPVKGDATGVCLKGMKYPLTDATVPSFSSLGISNEIVETEAVISVKEGILLIIESRD